MYREEIRYTFTTYIYFAVNSVINHGNKLKKEKDYKGRLETKNCATVGLNS